MQGEAGAHSTTPTYTAEKDSPAREPSWSAFSLQKLSILRVCVREEDAGGREAGEHSPTRGRVAGAPSDLEMQLENGRADDERVSRGQASERAVCVCAGRRRVPVSRPPCHNGRLFWCFSKREI